MAASNAADGCPAYSEVDHGTSQRLVAEEDYQPQDTLYPSSPPGFSSSEEEIPRGRKRKRYSYTMAKRSAGEALGLRNISLPPSSEPPPSSDTRDPSRKRSQSPAKTRNQLELCTPPVIHKSADYQPQHPVTRSRIKKFVQELSDETSMFTAAEKASTAVAYLEDPAHDWTESLRISGGMLLDCHNATYPPLDWDSLHAIHAASEQAVRELRHEDMWMTKVVSPLLQEALQTTPLEAHLVTYTAICREYVPTLYERPVDRKIDIVLGFEHSRYRSLGSYLRRHGKSYTRIHQMDDGIPGNIFIAAGLEIKRFGSSGEGEAVIQVMVWASSMLKFLKSILEEQWKRPRGQHKVPAVEDLPLLVVSTFVGDRWDFYVAYWELERGQLEDQYVEVIQGPFPVLSRSTSSLYNIARSVRQGQRFCAWAEKDFALNLLHIFGVDYAALQRDEKGENVIYPND